MLYLWLRPPSTASTWPVMKFDALRKYSTASATSSTVPDASRGRRRDHLFHARLLSEERITPGATEFTVISGANALASARVSMITPAFDAQ